MQHPFTPPTIVSRVIFLFPFLLLVILLLLSFFCYPSAEDLAIHYYDESKGLATNISDFYRNDSSRFFSFPLLFLLFNGDFIITHYYIIPLVLILSLLLSFYYLLAVISRHVLCFDRQRAFLSWLSALLLFAYAAIAFDPATIFYWISGSVTYLPSFIFFLLLAAQLIRLYHFGKNTALDFLLGILYTVFISGSNEISLYFLFGFLLLNLWMYYRVKSKINPYTGTLIVVLLICLVVLILPGGSGKRAHQFGSVHSITDSLMTALLYTARTFYTVLLEPVTWLVLVLAWAGGNKVPVTIKELFRKAGARGILIVGACLLFTFFFYFMIYFVSGERLPPRANSLVGFYVLFFLLLGAFFSGSRREVFPWSRLSGIRQILGVVVILLFFTNGLFISGIGDIFTGYAYHKIMTGREVSIQRAKEQGASTAIISNYEADYDKWLREAPWGNFAGRFTGKFNRYPRLIHYMDPVKDTSFYIHYYAEFRDIDSIQYGGAMYKRIGLFPGEAGSFLKTE